MKQYQFELATQKIAAIKQSGSREKKIVVERGNYDSAKHPHKNRGCTTSLAYMVSGSSPEWGRYGEPEIATVLWIGSLSNTLID